QGRTALDDFPRPIEALASIVSLGHEPLSLLYEYVSDGIAGGTPDKLRATRLLVARFDTRPHHRKMTAWHAQRHSLDVPAAERICRALLAIARDADCARLLGDRDQLLAMLRDPAEPPWHRARILKSSVAQLGAETVDAGFRALLREEASVHV